jgi:hypothetical protein
LFLTDLSSEIQVKYIFLSKNKLKMVKIFNGAAHAAMV